MKYLIAVVAFFACSTPLFAEDAAPSDMGAEFDRPEPIEMVIGTDPKSHNGNEFYDRGVGTAEEIKQTIDERDSVDSAHGLSKDDDDEPRYQ